MPAAEDLDPYLAPTWFIDCDTRGVRHRAEEVAAGATSDEERASRLFYAVRDGMATLNPLAAQIIGQLSSLEI